MIRRDGDPILKQVCLPFDAWHRAPELAEKMRQAMASEKGLGLAAPQIGQAVRAFVIRRDDQALSCFNPMIEETYDRRVRMQEGCLSFPGLFVWVERWMAIKVRFQNERAQFFHAMLRDQAAHVFQHEFDHLRGRTLRDLVSAQAFLVAKARAMSLAKAR